MISLKEIAKALDIQAPDVKLSALCSDNRQVSEGSLFIALKGLNFDARTAIAQAVEKGAAAVIYEDAEDGFVPQPVNVPCIGVKDLSRRQAKIASVFYGCPSADLELIGVTGTNGKSTTTHLVAAWLTEMGCRTGLLGTLGTGIYPTLQPCANTTLAAMELEKTLYGMKNSGASAAVMEVSSHGIALGRTSELRFDICAFTNLSRDHLDFHKTMENYAATKFELFKSVPSEKCVINAHDSVGSEFLTRLPGALAYSIKPIAGERVLYADSIEYLPHGIHISVGGSFGSAELQAPLIGSFNAENILCALGILLVKGYSLPELAASAHALKAVNGRMECFKKVGSPMIIVDYAHTPDGLEKALGAIREHKFGKITCICGCGGDRDTGKRPEMAEIACKNSDHVIFTNDNPRTEDPDRIIDMMVAGVKDRYDNYRVIKERESAITEAFLGSGDKDVLLVAGKGHEDYQIIGKTKYHYSDREVAMKLVGVDR
ncbi:UDP-N-acetylmuramoyl-L-alanyl-D-glutamate--2,6-diaminopimelate ligase [uncultured Ruminobacter sp.]|uniref:UDP-N-acetylmuramoyl-L-alanyl-D-glutamate--2, 6-diaminopimelate ligase n=1 Tax=uncultured Ruminobacter sp. TaxID=538947 RepID=UPI0025D761A0|nr:UDP-N-acetylmuramoyl-L-alanyl-D-glutamate--2,6-diaminopimelate ligase [uncultured Ruminobacter sp.]